MYNAEKDGSDFGNGIKNIYYQLRSKRGAPGKGNEADRQ
jgi:hypothetical protein